MRFVRTAENLFGLPQGFTRVEYLQSSGTQYIDTGYKPNNTTEYEIVGYMNPSGVFGVSRWSGEPTYDTFGAHSITANPLDYYGRYSSNKYLNLPSSVFSKQIVWKHTSTNISIKNVIDGTSYVNQNIVTDVFQSTYNLWIFGFNNMGTILSRSVGCKINTFKIWDNGVLIRDFIPCIDPLGVACMYDLVGKKPYYNQGTGTFTTGRKIIPVEYIESTGTQYIDTGVREDTTCVINMQATQSTNTTQVFLTNNTAGVRTKWFGSSGTTNYYSVGGSTGVSSVSATTKKECVVTFTNMYSTTGGSVSFYFKDDPANVYTRSDTVSGSITLTNICVGSSVSLYPSYIKLFGLKIYNASNVLLRDYIPCKDENNIGYMFDKVTHSAYLNAGSGSFTYGKTLPKKKLRLIKESKRRLPKGFTEVEYLESTGTQYIDTGVNADSDLGFDIGYKFTSLTPEDNTRWGAIRQVGGNYLRHHTSIPSSVAGYYLGTNNYKCSLPSNTNMHTISLDTVNHTLTVDGTLSSYTPETFDCNLNYYLLGRNNYLGSSSVGYFNGRLYFAKIYKSGVLVRDFIPCLDSLNVPCLYDKVWGKAYYNKGTGTFTTGRKIIPVEYLESSGTQYINTGFIPNQDTKVITKLKLSSVGTGGFAICGARQTSTSKTFSIQRMADGKWGGGYNTYTGSSSVAANTNTHILTKDKNVLYLDGEEVQTFTYATFTCPVSMHIFGLNNNGSASTASIGMSLYYFQIYDNTTLIRDYIPCKDENGVGFMFDKVTHSAYLNAGTGSFIIGKTLPKKKLRLIKESKRRLPKNFREVEYLESSGTQYVNTGILPTQLTKAKIEMQFTNVNYKQAVLGSNNGASGDAGWNNLFGTNENSSTAKPTYFWCQWGLSFDGPVTKDTNKHTHTFERNGDSSWTYTVDSASKTITSGISTQTSPKVMYLFACNNNGTTYRQAKVKVYRCQIWNNGTPVRDYIPCLDSSNVPCMYDLVEGKAYYNAGTGSFTYGHTITPVKYLESSGTQYIDTGYTSNNIYANSTCEVICETSDLSNRVVGCGGLSDNNKNISLSFSGGGYILGLYGDRWTSNIFAYSTNTKYKIKFEVSTSQQKLYVDNTLVETTTYSWNSSNNYPLRLFKTNADTYTKPTKIYSFKLWISGSLVKDLIPVKDENNVGYLLDLVTHTLYANAGSGSFVVGSEYKDITRFLEGE